MTSPVDQAKLLHDAPKDPPRVPRVGELLFEFMVGHDRYRCELRDHGPYGVEALFLINGDMDFIGRIFHPRLDPTRTPREMAIAWAEEERKALALSEGGVTR